VLRAVRSYAQPQTLCRRPAGLCPRLPALAAVGCVPELVGPRVLNLGGLGFVVCWASVIGGPGQSGGCGASPRLRVYVRLGVPPCGLERFPVLGVLSVANSHPSLN
jgi:hypothetical protein